MRSTMYNNSYFQKLLNNVQNKPNQDNSHPSSNLNIVDMKKKQKQNHNNSADISPMHVIAQNNQHAVNNLAANIMIKTSYGGGFGGATNNNP